METTSNSVKNSKYIQDAHSARIAKRQSRKELMRKKIVEMLKKHKHK